MVFFKRKTLKSVFWVSKIKYFHFSTKNNGQNRPLFSYFFNFNFIIYFSLTAEEAILQMNLLNHDFFVFYDPDFGGVNVVYRRKDGNYGLLAPELK